ncbi:MAG TPA: hypothetical protein DHD79_02665 [Firmicutes bacterium]|nr:hypothetical protein [Bacillota bacterium]HAW70934.1 hypothetical protein [Bacillota bacterium]HAZ21135.1 hypothetical protein [Bacillota bacterium]HBE07178.1 hypothetical protein [Bacillota bacterium]HBG42958.1 hypothetical protein [Bacillota bacterium]
MPRKTERDVHEAALRFLNRRGYSEYELKNRLLADGYNEEETQATLASLTRVGLINDDNYAREFIQLRLLHRPCGRALLAHELNARGIPSQAAWEVLDELYPRSQEGEYADRAVKARFGKPVTGKKAATFLTNRGFDEEVVWRYLEPNG